LYAEPRLCDAAPRLLLHAAELTLPHPRTGARLSLTSAAPF
jgi:tRNA pseudouridine32 synthase/23S rRNA pseudouridine746 synthase